MRSIIGSPTQCPCMQHATRCMYTRAALPPPLVHPLGPSHNAMERARRPLSIAPPLGQATRCYGRKIANTSGGGCLVM